MSGLAETIQYVSQRAEATLAATLQPLRDDFATWTRPTPRPWTRIHLR